MQGITIERRFSFEFDFTDIDFDCRNRGKEYGKRLINEQLFKIGQTPDFKG
ncbi:MAG: hypothetical protein OHK0017_12630 [Patescibacteria group bacterium]